MNGLKRLFKKKDKTPFHVTYEKGDIARVFDDLDETQTKKMRLSNYIEKLGSRQEKLASFAKFNEEEIAQLSSLVGQFKNIIEDKQHLKGRLIKTNRALLRLQEHEHELPTLIEEVELTERKVKENERDLYFLEEEKEHLIEDRETLLFGYSFLKGFSMVTALVMIIILFVGFALLQVLREGIWIYLSVVGIFLVLFVAGVLFCKEQLEKRLRNNELLQKKVVGYLNRIKIKYFHNKRYLEFNFDKLGVDSSAKLEMYYNRYIKNKENEKTYAKLNRTLMQIEESIDLVFRNKNIYFEEMEDLYEWLMTTKKAETLDSLTEEKEKIAFQIEGLTAFEEELWKEIYLLRENPKYTSIIEERIGKYLDKA